MTDTVDDHEGDEEQGPGAMVTPEPPEAEASDLTDFDDDDEYDEDLGASTAAGEPAEQLRALVHHLATSLVDTPDEVEVLVQQRGQTVQLNLIVPESELGKVIGRQGRIARAIRTVLMVAGSRHNLRASLDIEG